MLLLTESCLIKLSNKKLSRERSSVAFNHLGKYSLPKQIDAFIKLSRMSKSFIMLPIMKHLKQITLFLFFISSISLGFLFGKCSFLSF